MYCLLERVECKLLAIEARNPGLLHVQAKSPSRPEAILDIVAAFLLRDLSLVTRELQNFQERTLNRTRTLTPRTFSAMEPYNVSESVPV